MSTIQHIVSTGKQGPRGAQGIQGPVGPAGDAPVGSHVRIQSDKRLLNYDGMTLLHSGHFEPSAAWPDYPTDILGGQVALRWANVNTGIGTSGSRIAMADNGTAIMVSQDSGGVASRSADGGKTWQVLTLPGTGTLYSVSTDGKGTWILGGSYTRALLRSIDDGETWVEIPHGYTSGSINAVIPDGNGTWVMVSTVNNSAIKRSINNGETWTDIGTATGSGFWDGATDGNGLWVFCGGGGRILRSADDGATWTSTVLPGTTSLCYAIAYGDGLWLTGDSGGRIFRSADGGAWTQVAQISTGPAYQIAHDASGHWLVAQSGSTLARSDDGGLNWYKAAWPFGGAATTGYGCAWADGVWLLSGNGGPVLRSEDNAWIGIAGYEPGLYLRVA